MAGAVPPNTFAELIVMVGLPAAVQVPSVACTGSVTVKDWLVVSQVHEIAQTVVVEAR